MLNLIELKSTPEPTKSHHLLLVLSSTPPINSQQSTVDKSKSNGSYSNLNKGNDPRLNPLHQSEPNFRIPASSYLTI
jgi:hypothetical protein